MEDGYVLICCAAADRDRAAALGAALEALNRRAEISEKPDALDVAESCCILLMVSRALMCCTAVFPIVEYAVSRNHPVILVTLEELAPEEHLPCALRSVPIPWNEPEQLAAQILAALPGEEPVKASFANLQLPSPPAQTPPAASPMLFSGANRGMPRPSVPMPAPTAAPMPAAQPATARKQGLLDKLKGLFGKKEALISDVSDISFSALAPEKFRRGEYTMVDIYAYEEEFRRVVEQAKAEGSLKETDGGSLQVKKGTKIMVRLTSPDVEISDGEESRVWTGKYVKFDFPVFVPDSYEKKQLLFCASVYFDDVIATRLRFLAQVDACCPQKPTVERRDVNSVFISYASPDRDRVALILQGMRKSRPDLDVFFDVEALRSGEQWESVLRREIDRRDVLYLCWSRSARDSRWVDMEWRYALESKGTDAIEPVPLERPELCPPPPELESKHFSARELYYQR